MITGEIKSKVDKIWDTMWAGGISNPLSVVEQLTYLLFIKRLDEIEKREENKARRTGKYSRERLFGEDQQLLRWSHFREMAPERLFEVVRDEVFPFMKSPGSGSATPTGKYCTTRWPDCPASNPTTISNRACST
ncbi:type I restriction-modification system subunit M N-terminal domain-containing protein [Wenzhouxiangella sediminis]|uniref:N-6 DNA methylase n=1 Tax=Wenzhouxiangella sediminis TaxID=1792836 RepID=A0A3E1K6X8_9GAMM|nr:type I restriction-modification system subunit M N-terminal domain-containing protein [Wenzhouxiangella sediminis]RFF29780.1 N-6 DNA methylase [Wenzhouxiangella sediminis]